jgi:hypothetical protein
MRKFAAPLLFVLALASLPSPILAQCGVERWSVKTGTDADVGLINLSSSTAQTITTMRGWPAPSPIPANNRVSPYETTQWTLNATLTQYKAESDSDYHLVLSDASGNTLIAEIPSPSCVGAGSPFGPGIQNARNQFDARYNATSSFQTANIPVQIKGVGMFDFLHGQTGVAPNGIEIHAVLDIIFNPTGADFTIGSSPTSISVAQGTSGTSTISTTKSGTFNSAISLSASGLPAGATASFSPSSIAAPGTGSSTATITTSASTPVGTYTVTVTGTGGGLTHTTPITLTVTTASGGGVTTLTNGVAVTGLSGATGSFQYFKITVPAGQTSLAIPISGGTGDADLYVKLGAQPTTTVYDYRSIVSGNTDSVTVTNPAAGDWYIGLYGYAAYASVTLKATYSGGGGDTTAPTTSITAPTSGAIVSGTTTVSASASDNVGVTKVEFYLDGVLQSTDTTSPYSWSWNTTTASNASHTLTTKAYDAAGNIGTSAGVAVTVSNATAQQLLGNTGFETGTASPWVAASGVVTNSASEAAHGGTWKAWMDGYGAAHTDTLYQQVAIPSTITTATLTFWLHIDTAETTTTTAYDTLKLQIRNSSGTVLATLVTYSNLNANTGFAQKTFDLSAYKGQTIQVYLVGVEDGTLQTSFVVDDFALNVQ